MRLLEVEQRRDQVANYLPLVEPQAVDQHEHDAPGGLQRRHQKFGADIDGERRPVPLRVGEPAWIVLGDEALEVLAQALLQRAERFLKTRLVGRGEPHLPTRQLGDKLAPLAPRERGTATAFELAEARDEVAGEALLANAVTFEQARHDRQDLPRVHRLHEIVVDLDADGLAQQSVVFALRHHHDRHRRIDRADFRNQVETAAAGHLLVEQHDAVGLPPQHRDRVVAVRRLRHREPLLLEKTPVRGEAVHFIVNPENALRTRHIA